MSFGTFIRSSTMSSLVLKMPVSLQWRILNAKSCTNTLLAGGATSSFRGLSGALYAASRQATEYEPNLHNTKSRSKRYSSPSVASTFIQEFQRAKIPFTALGTLIFEKKCARFSYDQILGRNREKMFALYMSIDDIKKPDESSAGLDKTSSWQKQIPSHASWRSEFAAARYCSYKVYLIWEALYHNSPVFREIMKDDEKCEDHLERNHIESCILWLLLGTLFDGGYLDCEYVSKLPDPMIYTFIKDSQVAAV
ncbi:hypothetical protein TWF730_004363 [Orbilia blumenaviensis]|uniref:Uncharacterized protein n=1 Tax=Orbilia blumenaviensis TaxID=1796055 RepID=A0AAV9U214_9PEZI